MSTTQRSESINKFFKGFLNRNMLLLDFVRCIDKALVSRRQAETDADFYMNNVLPRLQLHMPIEEVASKIYTPTIFKKFQEELTGGLRYICEKIETDGNTSSYRCMVVGNESKYRVIRFNSVDHTANCICYKYESMGILCKHILRVFIVENVYQIPEQYVLKRRLGDAKSQIVIDEHGAQLHENCETPLTLRYSILCHEAIAIATSGIVSEDVYEVARAGFRRTRYEVEEAKKNSMVEGKNDGHINRSAVENNIIIRDPQVVKNKGRPGRFKAFPERKSSAKE